MSDSPHVFDVTQADFEEKVLAASNRVPVLVDFWAPWCAPCKALAPILDKLADEQQGKLLVAKVNTEDQMELAALFGVRSLPTVMLIRDGRPIDGFMGALPENEIRSFLEPHLGDLAIIPDAEPPAAIESRSAAEIVADARARAAAEPEKSELRMELARALMATGEVGEVESILDQLPANLSESDAARKLRAQLAFATALNGAPTMGELTASLADNPDNLRARHQLGTRFLLHGDSAQALEQFLEVMRRDRTFDDDLGRRTLIQAFAVIEDPDLVSATRKKMAAMLF